VSKVCEFAINVVAFLYLNGLLEIVAGNGAVSVEEDLDGVVER
jgi:hypothetical protein